MQLVDASKRIVVTYTNEKKKKKIVHLMMLKRQFREVDAFSGDTKDDYSF